MMFAEHVAFKNEFENTARKIRDIFVTARAIPNYDNYFEHHHKMPVFRFERMCLSGCDNTKVNIHLSCIVGDTQEWDIITVPVEFIDNFDAAEIKVFAEGLRQAEEQAKADQAAGAKKKHEEEQRALLASLQKQFPDMVPAHN